MGTKKKILIGILIIGIVLMGGMIILKQAPAEPAKEPADNSEVADSLQFGLKSDKEVYSQSEQLKLSLTFRNTLKDKDISICLFDIEHKLKEGLSFRHEGYPSEDGQFHTVTISVPSVDYILKDWTKRNLPVVSREDFIFLKPQEEYSIELRVDSVMPEHSSWRYIYGIQSGEYKWGDGLKGLPLGKYQISARYENSVDYWQEWFIEEGYHRTKPIHIDNAWTGTLISNSITIEVTEKKSISKEEAIKLVQNYIRKQNIKVIDINTPSEIRDHEDVWSISYAIEQEPDPLPPFRSFNVYKDDGETYEVPRR